MAKSSSPRSGGESAAPQEQEGQEPAVVAQATTSGSPSAPVAGAADATTGAASQDKPLKARVPYPHTAVRLPGGGPVPAEGERGDLVITREWTDVPADQVQRVKDTARRGGVKLVLAVPTSENGE